MGEQAVRPRERLRLQRSFGLCGSSSYLNPVYECPPEVGSFGAMLQLCVKDAVRDTFQMETHRTGPILIRVLNVPFRQQHICAGSPCRNKSQRARVLTSRTQW